MRTAMREKPMLATIDQEDLILEWGTMYLMVSKLRQGSYVPFFVHARKRSTNTFYPHLLAILFYWWIHHQAP